MDVVRMPYVEMPKDLTAIQTKVAFNLTKRQLVCFSLAAVVGMPTYIITRKYLGNDFAVVLMILLMLPFFMLALFQKNGQPFEKFLYHFVRLQLSPPIRIYKTQNMYSYLQGLGTGNEVKDSGGKQKRKKIKKPIKRHSKPTGETKKKPTGNKEYERIHAKKAKEK